MDLAKILAAIPDLLQMLALLFMALSLFATVVSRVTFWTKKDDNFVDSVVAKIISFTPVLGEDARTKELRKMVDELRAEKKEVSNESPEATVVKAG